MQERINIKDFIILIYVFPKFLLVSETVEMTT